MPLGTGSLALPNRKLSHWHVNTIRVFLFPWERRNRERMERRGKDEGWIGNKGGSGDVKTALLVEVLGVSLASLISEAIFRLCGDYCRFVR